MNDYYLKEVKRGKNIFDKLRQQHVSILKTGLLNAEDNEEIKDLFIKKDRDRLLARSIPLFNKLQQEIGITHWLFHELDGNIFLRVHSPELFGYPGQTRETYALAKKSSSWGTGIEVGAVGPALRVVYPYYHGQDQIGYMEMGENVANFINSLNYDDNSQYGMVIDKSYLNHSDWKAVREKNGLIDNYDKYNKYVLVSDASNTNNNILSQCFDDHILDNSSKEGNVYKQFKVADRSYFCGGFALYDAANIKIGAIVIFRDISAQINLVADIQKKILFFVTIYSLIILILLYIFIDRIVSAPLNKLAKYAQNISNGNLDLKANFKSNDEVGYLGRSFSNMATSIDNMAKDLNNYGAKLEDEVFNRTEILNEKIKELEKFQSLTVDRELKMVELKKKVKELNDSLKKRPQ